MNDEFRDTVERWHDENEYQKIVDAIQALRPEKQDDALLGRLASAYNNLGDNEAAIETLIRVTPPGQETALWCYRMGYSFYYSARIEVALRWFESALAMGDGNAQLYIGWCKRKLGLTSEPAALGRSKDDSTERVAHEDRPYVRVMIYDQTISVSFQNENPKPFAIGEKMAALHPSAYMNGYGWDAVLVHYLQVNHPDLVVGMDRDPEAGSCAVYYALSDQNKTRADAVMSVITYLIENEEALFDFVRAEGENIPWD